MCSHYWSKFLRSCISIQHKLFSSSPYISWLNIRDGFTFHPNFIFPHHYSLYSLELLRNLPRKRLSIIYLRPKPHRKNEIWSGPLWLVIVALHVHLYLPILSVSESSDDSWAVNIISDVEDTTYFCGWRHLNICWVFSSGLLIGIAYRKQVPKWKALHNGAISSMFRDLVAEKFSMSTQNMD